MKRIHLGGQFAFILLLLVVFGAGSCKKYLNAKPSLNLSVINSVYGLQALLSNSQNWSTDPVSATIGCDDYYITYDSWNAVGLPDNLCYTWDPNVDIFADWTLTYQYVYVMNNILDNISNIPAGDSTQDVNIIKGSALFYRADYFYELAQIFSPPLTGTNGSQPLGICLQLTSSVTSTLTRSTVQQTYDQIINDLKQSVSLLPSTTQYATNPVKASSLSLLARTYLAMQDYPNAYLYADSALNMDSALLDFNDIPDYTQPFSIPQLNQETIYFAQEIGDDIATPSFGYSIVDSLLYNSFTANDLRKTVYFDSIGIGQYEFVGTYATGSQSTFSGIAMDEVYLIRAECEARSGDVSDAMKDLNALLIKRWKTGTFVNYSATNATDALNQILTERRKELLFRGTSRWTDLRRLNQDPNYAKTLTRNLNGQIYSLAPNDFRYTFLIPVEVISYGNLKQNPR